MSEGDPKREDEHAVKAPTARHRARRGPEAVLDEQQGHEEGG
jgi:hypothetical protein